MRTQIGASGRLRISNGSERVTPLRKDRTQPRTQPKFRAPRKEGRSTVLSALCSRLQEICVLAALLSITSMQSNVRLKRRAAGLHTCRL